MWCCPVSSRSGHGVTLDPCPAGAQGVEGRPCPPPRPGHSGPTIPAPCLTAVALKRTAGRVAPGGLRGPRGGELRRSDPFSRAGLNFGARRGQQESGLGWGPEVFSPLVYLRMQVRGPHDSRHPAQLGFPAAGRVHPSEEAGQGEGYLPRLGDRRPMPCGTSATPSCSWPFRVPSLPGRSYLGGAWFLPSAGQEKPRVGSHAAWGTFLCSSCSSLLTTVLFCSVPVFQSCPD